MRLALILLLASPGCSLLSVSAIPPIDVPAAGTVCRIELKPERTGFASTSRTIYEGTIEASSDESVVLRAVRIEGCHEVSPVVSRVPVYGRLFRSSGVAARETDEIVTVARDRIDRVTLPSHPSPAIGDGREGP